MPSFLDRIVAEREQRRGSTELAWPVGADVAMESAYGHESEFPQETYADYIATSNEVFSAASLRARLMSRLHLNLYRGDGTDKQLVEAGPARDLLRHVNPFWTPRRLARMDELSMCIWGETIWALEYQGGIPSEIWWLKASRVNPVPDRDNYLKGFIYTSASGERIPFWPHEIVWFRYPNPRDEFSAMSPLAAARLAADTAQAMMQSNRDLHANGLQLGGIVVPADGKLTFKDGQAEELEALLEKRWSKPRMRRRWAVLRYEAQFKAMDMSPKDAEFVDGLNLTLRQVLNTYGIPSPLQNDTEQTNYGNLKELHRWLWEGALIPDAELKADEIVEQFLPRFNTVPGSPDFAAYDFTQIEALQEAASEAWGRERQAIEVGRLTINEVRARHGEPSVPWGDAWWAPVNKSAVKAESNKPEGDTAPAGEGEPTAVKASGKDVRNVVEMIQKIYLGVGVVLTADEARELLNRAGAGLELPGPFPEPDDDADEPTAPELPPVADPADNETPPDDEDADEDGADEDGADELARFLAQLDEWRLTTVAPNGRTPQ